ncbi:MAG: hypothetical protein KKD63_14840 [Proteobacteria bacterium]|nr:hypothetical protein [Desulfobulbaceae bacterium]MBU4154146.1 hypothetical protein [Pseudomonadota bacterium]MDP2104524.1 hypothetical protein [Desulfobulbaceae bacterium]
MAIDNEQGALSAIEGWRKEPLRAQRKHLQEAADSLELGAMYYEQKGNEAGVTRVTRCLNLIRTRQQEIDFEITE